jgi:hypothetical protein
VGVRDEPDHETENRMTDLKAGSLGRKEALRLFDGAVRAWHRAGRLTSLAVEGRSMVPTLPSRSRVWCVSLEQRPARRGEILLYRQGDLLIVHRVLRRLASGGYRTKGDGRASFDVEPVSSRAAIGRVVAFDRGTRVVSAEGRGPRFYAGLLALHSEIVGFLHRPAHWGDRRLRRLLGNGRLRPFSLMIGLSDRGVLRLVDAVIFPLFHRRWRPPEGPERIGRSKIADR